MELGFWRTVMSRIIAAVLTACLIGHLSSFAPAQPRPMAVKYDPYQAVLAGLQARCVGPANMGGRVVDIAAVESNPDIVYVATAGGGVWKTTDGGETFEAITDSLPTQCIGAVAVCQAKPEVVYVGTGEANPRNSVSWGKGVFKSTDGGKTWVNCGLADTHHIGRVVVHPKNPDIAYVAALGHIWGPNEERGVYRTVNGGKTWDKVKYIDENTGFIDLAMDPSDPKTLYAAGWEVRRDAFSGGSPKTGTGPNGGIFQTIDGGQTWEKLGGGLPEKVGYGRSGLSIYRKDPNVVFAIIQTSETVGAAGNTGQPATPATKDGKPGMPGPVNRGGVFRSDDKGKTWVKINDIVPRPFYYGQIRVDPTDDNNIYVLGVSLVGSTDGGKIFSVIGRGTHPDHHAMWINPQDSKHIILGNDGGVYVSKDRGKTFEAKRGLVMGQFYGVAVDMQVPYRIYGGLQDNGSWGGPSSTKYEDGITTADWRQYLGGDGFQAAVDPTDPSTVYLESQYGALSRVTVSATGSGGMGGKGGGRGRSIRPGSAAMGGMGAKGGGNRFNWNAPILLSPHDPKTLYYGSQFLYKTTNRGDKWEKISEDLTAYPKEGRPAVSGHTILSIAESPVKAGVLWVGTDDGKVWVSKDDGKEWIDLTEKIPGVPAARAIPKIECSHFDAGTAYVCIDRHRNDDFKPYIFLTTDYGESWKPLANNLPDGAVVGVVRQSSKAKDLLFAGTETGLYVSFDGGQIWRHLDKTGLPQAVRVDDLVIHPRDRELVIATHGRSIWIMDIAPLEQLTETVLTADAYLFDFKPVTLIELEKRPTNPSGFKAPNDPKYRGPMAAFLLTGEGPERVKFTWKSDKGEPASAEFPVKGPGLHFRWLGDQFKPGTYTITLEARGVKLTREVVVKAPEKVEKKAEPKDEPKEGKKDEIKKDG
jgi:photosystem II stability/assembly factor-like uncharacterized protein